jgi:hypothetical protein
MGDFYEANEVNPGYFCKYCGKPNKSMLKNEDTCSRCFKVDEEGKTKPKFDPATGAKVTERAQDVARVRYAAPSDDGLITDEEFRRAGLGPRAPSDVQQVVMPQHWIPVLQELPSAGNRYYLVGNAQTKQVAEARYLPRKHQWKFPSAARAFEITHWTEMPYPPFCLA